MPDPDIDNAIAVISASRAVTAFAKGSAMKALIADYNRKGQILFDPTMPKKVYGHSYSGFLSTRIKINETFRGDPATAAFIMAHEAVHRVLDDHSTITGELTCRTFDVAFGSELIQGIGYPSGGRTVMANLSGSQILNEIRTTISAEASQNQIDRILMMKIYQENLKGQWVAANLTKWGGLRNRTDNSLGHYLNAIALDRSLNIGTAAVEVLEAAAAPGRSWPTIKGLITDRLGLKQALRRVYDAPLAGRKLMELEKKLGEKFG